MIHQFVKAQLKLMKYGAFIGIIGGIASFIGPNHHGLIKTMIGVVIGCALLGKRNVVNAKRQVTAKCHLPNRLQIYHF